MNQLKKYTLAGTVFVLILGSLCHFFYEWSGYNTIIGLFCPVNESTWEHMKLIFFPMLLYSFFMVPRCRTQYPCITAAYPLGLLLGTFLIPVLFYTYSGILGRDVLFLDLLTFGLSVISGFYAVYRLTLSCRFKKYTPVLRGIVWFLVLCFMVFSYFPPSIGLFAIPS